MDTGFLQSIGFAPENSAFWFLLAGVLFIALLAMVYAREIRRSQRLRNQLEEARVELSAARTRAGELPALKDEIDALRQAKAMLESDAAAQAVRLAERERALAEMRERMDTDFRATASEMLKDARKVFLEQAKESFAHHREATTLELDNRRKALDDLLKPVSDTLVRYEKGLKELRDEQQKSRGELTNQLGELSKFTDNVSREAQKLATALRAGPKTRGRWGEEQLKNVVEIAGMTAYVDFTEQTSHADGDKRKIPDMVVRLPGERVIAVDSKVSLGAYLDAVEAETDEARAAALSRHADDLWNHVKSLATKDYAASLKDALDYTVMFIPGESYFAAALEARPQLHQEAFERKILIASPTILIAVLKSAALNWRQEKMTEHAHAVAAMAKDLHDSLRTMGVNIASLGRALESAVKKYNLTVGGFEQRVMSRARKFADYEIPGIENDIENLAAIEPRPRELRSDKDLYVTDERANETDAA
ncbi:MAG: DNA recombination protein RmuC [Marinicaulis sp.]|nr:DNA recombination protein RmuC [Marinicaulis sp.]NNE40654.1 DNA recombination protein RmuC [Marinicaulis sp.]NNL90462.1 DNA recombination protein RmuC [Marinicaulis sp.]